MEMPRGSVSEEQPGLAQMAQQSYGSWAPQDWSQEGLGEGLFGSRPVSSPDLAKYFDAYGGYKMDDPRQVAADTGQSLAQLSSGFLPRQGLTGIGYEYGSDKGGFFNAADLYRKLGRDIPGIATFNQAAPSTNNWRLLGMGPGWIMRNGSLINTLEGGVRRGGALGHDMGIGITGETGGMSAGARASQLGTGASGGTPNRWGDGFYWPGAYTGGYADRYPYGTNV